MENLGEKIFDLPKTEAEEKAYNFFGLNRHATITDINRAFRKEKAKYHPDNKLTGDKQKFLIANIQMEVLKLARNTNKNEIVGYHIMVEASIPGSLF